MVVASCIIWAEWSLPLSRRSASRRDIFFVDFELPFWDYLGVLGHVCCAEGMVHVRACVCVA